MRTSKLLVGVVALTFLFFTAGYAQKGGSKSSGSGSSRPPSSSSKPPGSSSKPPSASSKPPRSSSKPPSSPSKPPTSSSRPPSTSNGQSSNKPSGGGPMFGGSKSSNPSAGAGPAVPSQTRPSSSGQSSNKPSGSMFGGSKPRSEPTRTIQQTNNNTQTSSMPAASGNTGKAQAQRREESRQAYITSQRATAPPRTEAVVGGSTVNVDTASPALTQLRNRPSTYIEPTVRRERAVNHITINHYQHPVNYYWDRPVSYGIGPYSNGFWWMMMEWDANRRADWLYNNQARLSTEAYAAARQDAAVQQRLAALEAQQAPRNTNYVDPEYAADPTDQYDQSYVEAAYNPAVMPVYVSNGSGRKTVVVVLLVIAFAGAVVFVIVKVRWGT